MRGMITALMLWAAVAVGQVMEFDGVDQYIDVGAIPPSSQMTFAAWVFPRSYAASIGSYVISKSYGYTMRYTTNGKLQFAIPSVAAASASNSSIPLNEWSFAATTWDRDSNVVNYYINGALDRTVAFSSEPTGSAVTSLGGLTSSYTVDGYLDSIRIYSSILTSNQVARLTLDTCEMYEPTLWTNAALHAAAETWDTGYGNTNLAGAWRGDRTGKGNGNSFTNLPDLSGNGNDGTAYNSPTIEAAR